MMNGMSSFIAVDIQNVKRHSHFVNKSHNQIFVLKCRQIDFQCKDKTEISSLGALIAPNEFHRQFF